MEIGNRTESLLIPENHELDNFYHKTRSPNLRKELLTLDNREFLLTTVKRNFESSIKAVVFFVL